MAALAGTLADGLDVRLGTRSLAVDRAEALVAWPTAAPWSRHGVVLTPPVPRSLALIDAAGAPLPVEAARPSRR